MEIRGILIIDQSLWSWGKGEEGVEKANGNYEEI